VKAPIGHKLQLDVGLAGALASRIMKESKTFIYVGSTVALAAALGAAAWQVTLPNPGLWALCSFVVVAYLIDLSGNPLRVEAKGSASFIIHLAAGVLFGGFWGGFVAAASTAASEWTSRRPGVKIVFNTAQRFLSVVLGSFLYQALGGGLPPAYLALNVGVQSADVQRDLGLFFVFGATYFAVNTIAVNAAVAISSGRRFGEVWNLNAKGVLGYDLGASAIALVVAFFYRKAEHLLGFGPLGLISVTIPVIVIRHIYGLYRRLQNSGRELLDLMVKAIEARDPYTSGHSIRVATLSKAIAQEAKMTSDQVEEVYTAAVLHDVGKIHEEFAPLLRKDSKLTPEEMALLQTHSVKSAELVAIISSFRGAIHDAVRSHHERWDGHGYPDGIAGDAIPLGARIIMISDTTDAMTTDRPYRKKLTVEAVVGELQKCRGTQFDPNLVDLVVNSVVIRRVMAEISQASDGGEKAVPREGGSKRVSWGTGATRRARRSWLGA
jgi:HD-GYP domain-containing protein (c-di-GMP phosphodiesterase class II)